MEERRASMKAYKKVHNKTVRSGLGMAIMQQSMEIDMWDIKEKLAERREQMAIRAYEEDKRREDLNQKIEEVINLIQCFIQNPISPVKTPQTVTTNVSSKLVQNTPRFEENSGKSYTCSDEVKNEFIGAPESANNQDKRSMTWAGDQSRMLEKDVPSHGTRKQQLSRLIFGAELECPVEFALRSFEGLHCDLGKGQERRT
ncbi:hypothetical protein Tco_1190263 [Tanacetum coccineum]